MLLIDSMPPATAMSMSPAAMPCAASITALRPEPHTLLIVIAATCSCEPAVERRLARRVLPLAGGDDVAHDAFVDGGGIDAGAAHRLAHGDGAELGRGEIFQGAEELARRRPGGGDDNRLTH